MSDRRVVRTKKYIRSMGYPNRHPIWSQRGTVVERDGDFVSVLWDLDPEPMWVKECAVAPAHEPTARRDDEPDGYVAQYGEAGGGWARPCWSRQNPQCGCPLCVADREGARR